MKETERFDERRPRRYQLRDGQKPRPPSFDRIIARLSDAELEEERARFKPGERDDFARALDAEKRRRHRGS